MAEEAIKVDLSQPKEEVVATPETQVEEVAAEEAAPPKAAFESVTPQNEAGDFVVDLSKTKPKTEEDGEQVSNEQQEPETESVAETEESKEPESPIEIINEEEPAPESVEEPVQPTAATVDAIQEAAQDPKIELPENVEKLISFMEETGGTVEDYVNLNKDLSSYDDNALLREYYRQAKPSWDESDIADHMGDQFSYDEELDEPRDIRAKKRAFKDELYNAKKFLEGNREKYYADLKLRKQTDIPQEYQQAYDLAEDYKKSAETNKQLQDVFKTKTKQVFTDLKGFDFKIGESKYRYKVNEPSKVQEYQSDINNFVKEFLAEDGTIADAAGYHKALFAAKNADKIAQHFYEQGRAEALKQSAAEAKNISMDPRQDMTAIKTEKSGTKARIVTESGFDGKLRFKNYKNR